MACKPRSTRLAAVAAAFALAGSALPTFAQGNIGPSANTGSFPKSIGLLVPSPEASSGPNTLEPAAPSIKPPAPQFQAPAALSDSLVPPTQRYREEAPVSTDRFAAEQEYRDFLIKVGFQSHDNTDPSDPTLSRLQKSVLRRGRVKRQNMESARELAVKTMAGLKALGYPAQALDKAADMAADLIALKPLAAPRNPPLDFHSASVRPALRWLLDATHKRISRQMDTLAIRLENIDPALAEEKPAIRSMLRDVLIPMYADSDIGHSRHAGRALTAALVRYARQGHGEFERALEAKFEQKGLRLSDYIGRRFQIRDYRGKAHVFELQSGDIVARRPRDRSAAEITAAVRPHWSRLWRAWRQRLLGPLIGIWLDPAQESPAQIPGQTTRNAVRRAIFYARRWLGGRRFFLRGYSHIGKVEVAQADGVSLIWVYHSFMNAWEGSIYQSALLHEFLVLSRHVRFGFARMAGPRAAKEFLKQARSVGYKAYPYQAEDGAWKAGNSEADHEYLQTVARADPDLFLKEMHARILAQIKTMMARGVAYAECFMDRINRVQCASLEVLAHVLGLQFDPQSKQDQWRPIVRWLHRRGLANTPGLRVDLRIIWPGSFFANPNYPIHEYVELSAPIYPPPPRPRPEYVESPSETAAAKNDETARALRKTLIPQLLARQRRRKGTVGWRTGISDATDYFNDIEMQLRDRKPNALTE